VYEGDYLNDLQHGQGTYTWKNGDTYVGGYKAGKRDGQGQYKWKTGWQYNGGWTANVRNGPAEIRTPDGITYKGVCEANKMDVEFPSGRKYLTEFVLGGIPKDLDGFNKAALLIDPDVTTLFAAMNVSNNGKVSKFEYIEFVREHKPRGYGITGGTAVSVVELQSFFGFQNHHEISHDAFQKVFAVHSLDPKMFGGEYAVDSSSRSFLAPRALAGGSTIVVSHHSAQVHMQVAVCYALEQAGFKVFQKNNVRNHEKASVFDEYVDASTVCVPLLSTEYFADKDCVAQLAAMVAKGKKIVALKVTPFNAAKVPSNVVKALKNVVPKSEEAVFGDNFDGYVKTLVAGLAAAGVESSSNIK
jgi:hypothetical protein